MPINAKQRRESREADPGAALECIIAQNLIELKHITPTKRCLSKQSRDRAAVDRIDINLKEQFESAAVKIVEFIKDKFISDSAYEIDRTEDNDDSVEDIVLQNKDEKINFSIKHNNDSIKHNRPFSLVSNGLGFKKGSLEDIEHRHRLIKKCDELRINFPLASRFSDLPMNTKEDLYFQLVDECRKSLEKYKKDTKAVSNLFNFIMGKNYLKIKVLTRRKKNNFVILFEDFREDSPQPKSFEITSPWKGQRKGNKCASWNFEVIFDNGYKFTHRIHNASSRINQKNHSQLSVKFDVKFTEDSARGKQII